MPAPIPLTMLLLRHARSMESPGTGLPSNTLAQMRAALIASAGNAGRLITSVSSNGKSYAFGGAGYSTDVVTNALDDAERIWISYSQAELTALLDTRRARTTIATFGGAY